MHSLDAADCRLHVVVYLSVCIVRPLADRTIKEGVRLGQRGHFAIVEHNLVRLIALADTDHVCKNPKATGRVPNACARKKAVQGPKWVSRLKEHGLLREMRHAIHCVCT